MTDPAVRSVEPPRDRPRQAATRAFDWFFAPIDGAAMELARVAFGAILLAAYGRLLPVVAIAFGPSGIGGHDTLARTPGYTGLAFQAFARLRFFDQLASLWPIAALYALLLASAAAFALGIMTRWSGALAALLNLAFTAHNPHLRGGWSWLLTPFTLYVAACGSDARLSLPAAWRRLRGLAPKSPLIAPWGMRLLMVHASTMYLVAGWERLDAPGWLHGDMVLHSLVNTVYGRFGVDWLAYRPLLTAASYFVFALEPVAPIMLWIPRARRFFLPLLLAMHLGIELFIEVGWWQWLMIAALIAFFPQPWLDRLPPQAWLAAR